MPLKEVYKYILMLACVFSYWVQAFLHWKATALVVGKIPLGGMTPTGRIPARLHSHHGTRFIG